MKRTFQEFRERVAKVEETCPEAPAAIEVMPEANAPETDLVLYLGPGIAEVYISGPADGMPASVFYGEAVTFRLPDELVASDLAAMLEELAPNVDTVTRGIERVWDGSRWRGRWSREAKAAVEEIERIINFWESKGQRAVFDESEIRWLRGYTDQEIRENLERLGSIQALAEYYRKEAFCQGVVFETEDLELALRHRLNLE